MSTILYPHLLNALEHFYQRIAAPPLSVAAQSDALLPMAVIIGLVVLLIAALVLFWRMSRKPHAAPATPAEEPDTVPIPFAAPTPPAISLDFIADSEQYISFNLDKPALTIGRASDNDIVVVAPILKVDTVSQHHARLRRDPDGYVVRDLGSKNGMTVNGRQTIENLLQDGDRLRFGEVEAIFHQSAGGAA